MDQYTVSLLHFDENLQDESGKIWTAQNGAQVGTTQGKFGGALNLNGVNQYITTPNSTDFDFGTGDFTIDWYEYRLNLGNGATVCRSSSPGYQAFAIGVLSGNPVRAYLSSNNTAWGIGALSMGNATANVWTHYALVRQGTRFYSFQNGKLIATLSSDLPLAPSTGEVVIGKYNTGSYFTGYIDEMRISKGIARWTSDFTPPTAPDDIGINPPTNLTATAGDSQITLSWTAVSGATGYNVKRSTTAGGPYTTIATKVTGTTYIDKAVTNGITYYYVVTAVDGSGNESANSNEASATPQAPSGHGLLRITMNDSSEREYRLSTGEIESFIKWYDRTVCTGNTCYAFDDIVDLSKEYLSFEKIISFKVIPLKY